MKIIATVIKKGICRQMDIEEERGNIFQINSLTLLLVVIVHKKIKSLIISSFIKYTKHNTQYQVNVSKTFYISMVSWSKTFNNSFHT